jgi:hypothetical protein
VLSDPLPDPLNLRVANAQSRFGCSAIAELITRPGRVVGIHCPSVFTSHDVNVSASSMNKLGLISTTTLQRRMLEVVSPWRTFAGTGTHCSVTARTVLLMCASCFRLIPARHTTSNLADPQLEGPSATEPAGSRNCDKARRCWPRSHLARASGAETDWHGYRSNR